MGQLLNGPRNRFAFLSKMEGKSVPDSILIALLLGYFFSALLAMRFSSLGAFLFTAAFLLHTGYLGWQVYLLKRPPVATMQETFPYVAWVAILTALLFRKKLSLLLPCSALLAAALLLLAASLKAPLAPLQPVLNSPLWLSTHVLIIVASYAFFLMGAALAHIYLTTRREEIAKVLFPCIFIGTGLFIIGTLLGGLWAARTWGSFWSWDPKESWAFIAICIYLTSLHTHSLGLTKPATASLISCIGFLSITFTWYGMNYILKKGMHSYGFGSANALYYYLFVGADLALLAFLYFKGNYEKNFPLHSD